MKNFGSEAIVEWVDGLEELNLNVALRCLALNDEGSIAERRYIGWSGSNLGDSITPTCRGQRATARPYLDPLS